MEWKLARNDPQEAKEYFEGKMRFTLGPMELQHYWEQGSPMSIVDVRREEDYEKGHVPGAISLPEERWQTFDGLSRDKPNILYCYSVVCHLAAKAAAYFASRGYSVCELEGGFDSWKQYSLPLEKGVLAHR